MRNISTAKYFAQLETRLKRLKVHSHFSVIGRTAYLIAHAWMIENDGRERFPICHVWLFFWAEVVVPWIQFSVLTQRPYKGKMINFVELLEL